MDESKYHSFTTLDFILDDDFLRFVRHPDSGDTEFWEAFIHKYPEKANEIKEARLVILSMEPVQANPSSLQMQKTWLRIEAKNRTRKSRLLIVRRNLRWIAAIPVVTALLMFFIFMQPTSQLFTYSTGFGQTASVLLPDSSTVFLNANSTLKVQYGGIFSSRTMELNGEAYFKIEKSRNFGYNQPCRVVTNQAVVNVTGTRFNVNARNKKTDIFLEEGSVNLSNIQGVSSMVLTPGDAVSIDAQTKSISRTKSANENYTGWVSGNLVFNQTPVSAILDKIEEHYGLTSHVSNEALLSKTFTGKVPSDDLEILLRALQETFNLAVDKKNNALYFKTLKRLG